jgi:hypothetical protein
LFTKIVDSFYEQVGDEYFSPEDLADIQGGLDEIKRGEHLAWEDSPGSNGHLRSWRILIGRRAIAGALNQAKNLSSYMIEDRSNSL